MKKAMFVLFSVLFTSATAQQAAKVSFAPVTIDGVTTANSLISVNGKNYVSVDALKNSGITLLKSNSLGIYKFPNRQGVPVSLKDCMNEWLSNGIDRIRIDGFKRSDYDGSMLINSTVQTSVNEGDSKHFDISSAVVVYNNGRIIEPSKNPFQKIAMTTSASENLR